MISDPVKDGENRRKVRVMAFIDGFNFYYSLEKIDKNGNYPYRRYKWLDYSKLVQRKLEENEELVGTYLFTAYRTSPDKNQYIRHMFPRYREKTEEKWLEHRKNNENVQKRHRDYSNALKNQGVKIIEGNYQHNKMECPGCNIHYFKSEEKQTDINLCLWLFEKAYKNEYEKAVIVSADSDLLSGYYSMKRNFPTIDVVFLFPIERDFFKIREKVTNYYTINERDLALSQLPDVVTLQNGKKLKRPLTWV